MQPPLEARHSDDLICGVCGKYLHVPYTLPCEHSYCLEPCLIARPSQTEVRCLRCNQIYPLRLAVRNAVLEKRVAQCLVEERRSIVVTCSACQHPAPVLRECQHCEARICSVCRNSHAAEVVTSVTKSTGALLKKKTDLKEVRDLLKTESHIQAIRLKHFIEQATFELEGACNRLLDRSTANLNDLFDEHQAELNASEGTICYMKGIIKKCTLRKEFIPKMAVGPLLTMKKVLEGVSTLSKCICYGVIECEERFNLHADYSLPGLLKTLSLIDVTDQKENSHEDRKKVVSNVTKSGHHLVVDGLPALARVDDIRSFFGQFGAITKVTLGERMDSALVTFSTAEAVQRAIGAASLRLKGANLRVSLPEDHEYSTDGKVEVKDSHLQDGDVSESINLISPLVRSSGWTDPEPKMEQKKGQGTDSNDAKSGHHLLVDGLPALARVDDIRSIFGQFGAITKVTLGERMDSAIVTFSTAEAVQRAMGAASLRLKGANLRVSLPEDHEYRSVNRCLLS